MILKTSCLIDRQYENFIKDIAFFNPRDFKRWYDKNPNIHLAIEALRDLTSVQQEEVVQEFCDKILKRHDSEKKVENK